MNKEYYIYKAGNKVKKIKCSYEEAIKRAEENKKLINLIDRLRK